MMYRKYHGQNKERRKVSTDPALSSATPRKDAYLFHPVPTEQQTSGHAQVSSPPNTDGIELQRTPVTLRTSNSCKLRKHVRCIATHYTQVHAARLAIQATPPSIYHSCVSIKMYFYFGEVRAIN